MAVITPERQPADRRSATPPSERRSRRRVPLAHVATLVVGAAACWIVVRDGEAQWQLLRAAAVVASTVAVLAACRRWVPPARAAVQVGWGITGVVLGIGIGLPHLAKAGPAVTTTAGVLSLAGGLALLVTGAAGILRPMRWPARVAGLAGILVLVAVAGWSFGQAVAVTNVPPTRLDGRTPADAGLVYETVTFRSADGVQLAGWYLPSTTGSAVVLLHGAGSTRSGVLDEAVVLADHGYGVLLFDARGHGESDGRAMDFGWNGDADVAGAVSFLAERSEVDPRRIAAVGTSMGGEEAIGAAAADPRIQAVVAEGATNRTAADWAWLSDEFGARGWLQEQVNRLTYGATDLLTDASPPISLRDAVAAAAPRPVLLVTGGLAPDEASAARFIRSGAPDSVRIWTVEGAGHTAGLATEPDAWSEEVVGFLDAALEADRPGR